VPPVDPVEQAPGTVSSFITAATALAGLACVVAGIARSDMGMLTFGGGLLTTSGMSRAVNQPKDDK
jgi:hypothetical protein